MTWLRHFHKSYVCTIYSAYIFVSAVGASVFDSDLSSMLRYLFAVLGGDSFLLPFISRTSSLHSLIFLTPFKKNIQTSYNLLECLLRNEISVEVIIYHKACLRVANSYPNEISVEVDSYHKGFRRVVYSYPDKPSVA